jgi:predicted RNase H-like HicB family nuclease
MKKRFLGKVKSFGAVYRPEPRGGYSALCPELGVASQGETIEEAEANLKEAVELYLESAKELGILALPRKRTTSR